MINVSADNLGAVIKILSRWEVNRNDFNKTPAPSRLPTREVPFSPCLPCVLGRICPTPESSHLGEKLDLVHHLKGRNRPRRSHGVSPLVRGQREQNGELLCLWVPRSVEIPNTQRVSIRNVLGDQTLGLGALLFLVTNVTWVQDRLSSDETKSNPCVQTGWGRLRATSPWGICACSWRLC